MFALSVSYAVSAQISVSGVVTDNTGESIPGVSVVIPGTTTGVLTGLNGEYTITVPSSSSQLSFSFIGYTTQTVTVGNQRTINITLAEDVQQLDEIVVVGYGTQAKKDITGSVAVVSAEALAESSAVTFSQALQGKSAGVYVSTTGAPGSGSTIRVRGVGSVNGSDPLVIIDGVSGGNINSVNANDIESFQVLKDASATAIYGAQGANGVIIVTTKQGTKTGQARVSYNGYVGISQMANNGYDLVDGWEMMEMVADGQRNLHNYRGVANPAGNVQFGSLYGYTVNPDGTWSGGYLTMPYASYPAGNSYQDIVDEYGSIEAWEAAYLPDGGHSYARTAFYQTLIDRGYGDFINDPSLYAGLTGQQVYEKIAAHVSPADLAAAREGSNWYSMIVQNGLIQDHQVSVIGGNDKGQYSMSISYTGQEGTVKASYFDRYSLRVNSTFNPRKYISIGVNSNLAVTESAGQGSGNSESSVFGQSYMVKQWVPAYNIGGDFGGTVSPDGGRTTSSLSMVENAKGDWTRNLNSQNSLFLEVKPIPELTLRTQAAARIGVSWGRTFNENQAPYNGEASSSRNSFSENGSWSLNLQWTNTATYTKKFGNNNVTVVLGTEALDQGYGRNISASRYDYTYPSLENTWVIGNGSLVDLSNGGGQGSHTSMFGYFGRADYSYKGKYLATITVRRDASSKFSEKNRWGTFPSVSLGWRVSDEPFMAGTKGWLSDLKLRVGYGTTGNSNIGSYNWAYQYSTGANYHYSFDGANNAASTGYAVSSLGDMDARWETTRMANAGVDVSFFKDRLDISFDYYIKKTTDMLVSATANFSSLAGSASKPNINIGDMDNHGWDLQVGWSDKAGKFGYSLTGNLSHYRNEVIKLGAANLYDGVRFGNIKITTPGQPIGMFYGRKVIGLYTSVEDVLNYKDKNGNTILPHGITSISDLNPSNFVGRYKFEDVNGDGRINDSDATIIGNPHPDLTGGLNISLEYGNWDLSSYLYASIGNEIYRVYMSYMYFGYLNANYSRDRWKNSWSPDNPDGVYPMWVGTAGEGPETASVSNDTYLQDGSYLRMQNISLGYSLPKAVLNKIGVTKLRVYGQISNPFTITKYDGLDPEINTSSDRTRGVDYGGYGIPRQYMVGVNLTF